MRTIDKAIKTLDAVVNTTSAEFRSVMNSVNRIMEDNARRRISKNDAKILLDRLKSGITYGGSGSLTKGQVDLLISNIEKSKGRLV